MLRSERVLYDANFLMEVSSPIQNENALKTFSSFHFVDILCWIVFMFLYFVHLVECDIMKSSWGNVHVCEEAILRRQTEESRFVLKMLSGSSKN